MVQLRDDGGLPACQRPGVVCANDLDTPGGVGAIAGGAATLEQHWSFAVGSGGEANRPAIHASPGEHHVMRIVLDSQSTSNRRKRKLQARFDELQQKLARQEQRNRKFGEELDDLARRYMTELSRIDNDHLANRTRLAEKLLEFFTRKSLSNWHREELAEWIVETISRIGSVDDETAERLHGRFRQIVADQMGMSEAELAEEARLSFESVAEAFEDFDFEKSDDTGIGLDDDGQEDLFGYDDVFREAAAGENEREADPADRPGARDAVASSRGLMDGSWVRTLFHRTAKALHPDREQDPAQRAPKERLMQRLLEARRQGDIMSLLKLYGESAAEGQVVLAKEEMEKACELLEARLRELQEEQDDLILTDPVRGFVYSELYAPTRRKRERNLQAWKASMEAEAAQVWNWIEEMRNLQVLKLALEERREARLFRSFDVALEGLDPMR